MPAERSRRLRSMTMGPWWCSRESKGLRPLSWLRLSRRLRRPRSPKTDSCPRALPCSPQRHLRSGTAVASLRAVRHRVALPGRDRSPIHRLEPGCLISSFLPHTWWILSRLDRSHSLEALSWRDLAGEIRLRRTGSWAPTCTRDSGSTVGGENYADLVRGGLVVAGFAAGDAIHEA